MADANAEASAGLETTRTFEALLAGVLPVAYGVAIRLVRNRADAEDLIQEAALQAFRGFSGFEIGTNFKAWYLRILTNCFYAGHRKKQREPDTIRLDDAPPLYLYDRAIESGLAARSDDPAALILGRIDEEQIAAAIAALPPEFRVVTALYFIDDMSYEEIAAIVDCPIGTVRSRLHRGRRMLQKALWHFAEERGVISALQANAKSAEA